MLSGALGGRNSQMGKYLGQGTLYKVAKEKFMKDITVSTTTAGNHGKSVAWG